MAVKHLEALTSSLICNWLNFIVLKHQRAAISHFRATERCCLRCKEHGKTSEKRYFENKGDEIAYHSNRLITEIILLLDLPMTEAKEITLKANRALGAKHYWFFQANLRNSQSKHATAPSNLHENGEKQNVEWQAKNNPTQTADMKSFGQAQLDETVVAV